MGSSAVFPKKQLLFLVCFICFICPKHMMFVSKTIRCPSGECQDTRHGFSSNQRILKLDSASNFRKTPICEISIQKEPVFFQENRLLCFVCFICFLCLVCLLCRGLRRSRPSALPSIAYRGFAVAPMTLRAPSRNLVYNPGSRVATLVVSMGVMGFLGDLRGKNRNFPLIP